MFEQAERMSTVLTGASGAGLLQGTLVPALSGCRDCGTAQIIAAPSLGACPDCGGALTVLDPGALGSAPGRTAL